MVATQNKMSESGRATVVASAVALVLVLVKITVGIGTGAMVLVASAVDSGLDFLVSVFNHVAVRNAEKPSDERFNYGFGKIEGLASFLEGLVIAASSLVIILTAGLKIYKAEGVDHPTVAVGVMAVSTLLTAALVVYLNGVAGRTGSLVIKADSLHYKMDLYTNLGILAALLVITKFADLPYVHFIDPVISICIAAYILHTSWGLIKEGMEMLLDRALPEEITRRIEELIPEVAPQLQSFHELKTRKSANLNFVDVHLVFNRDISLMEAHRISDEVERRIQALEDVRWIINCHMDPVDDSSRDKQRLPEA